MKIKIIIAVSLVAVALTVWFATNLLGCGLLNTNTEQGYASDRAFRTSTVESFAFETTTIDSLDSGPKAQSTTIDTDVAAEQMDIVQNGSISHILYVKRVTALQYATNAGGSWTISTINNSSASGAYFSDPSIALDSTGHPHIAYIGTFDAPANYLKKYALMYGTNASGSWESSVILSPYRFLNSMGEEMCIHYEKTAKIMVDSSDKIHIVYVLLTTEAGAVEYNVYHATNASGSWVTTCLWDQNIGHPSTTKPSAVIDARNKIHVCFWSVPTKNLTYLTNASGSWTNTTIATNKGTRNSISLDRDGNPYIIYSEDATVQNGPSMEYYATNASGSWVSRAITDLCPSSVSNSLYMREDLQLKFTPDNRKHLAWAHSIQLEYLTDSSGSWQKYLLLPSATRAKFDFDSSGSPIFLATQYVASSNTFNLLHINELPAPTGEAH